MGWRCAPVPPARPAGCLCFCLSVCPSRSQARPRGSERLKAGLSGLCLGRQLRAKPWVSRLHVQMVVSAAPEGTWSA